MVNVIDEPCGKGKTSWAIQYMSDHLEKSFVYATPFLNEIDRVKRDCTYPMWSPENYDKSKLEDFNELLADGKSIAVTHKTFSNANAVTVENIKKNGKYTLILDEVIDPLVPFNSACNDHLSHDDIKLLFENQFLTHDDYGKVEWINAPYEKSKYANVERLAEQGDLYYLDDSALYWQLPPELFDAFNEVYLLTYLFEGSLFKPYLEYHKIPYQKAGVQEEDGVYQLTEWKDDRSGREKYRELIHICTDRKLNHYFNKALSKNWFRKASPDEFKRLKDDVYNYVRNITNAKSRDIMWTCYEDFSDKLKGTGYTRINLTEEEKEGKSEKEIEKMQSCFVPSNERATNLYRDRSVMIYGVNLYPNPYVTRYFQNRNDNDGMDVQVNEDYFALSTLLQWIFRSCLRDGKPAEVYIPSERMRTLLMKWLNGEM